MKVTPYRLGMRVGEANDDLPLPYTTPRSVAAYREGVRYGEMRRKVAEGAARLLKAQEAANGA